MGSERQLVLCGDPICPCQDGDACHYIAHDGFRASLLEVKYHEANLRRLRCVISAHTSVTLHHCHGGSVKDAGWQVGMAQKQNPFLQIPLHAKYHTGDLGIDRIGVITWEDRFAPQLELLHEVNGRLPYDIFQQAVTWEWANRKKSANTETAKWNWKASLSIPCGKPTDTSN